MIDPPRPRRRLRPDGPKRDVTQDYKPRKSVPRKRKTAKTPARPKVVKTFDPSRLQVKTDVEWEVVTRDNIQAVIGEAMEQRAVAYDVETTGTKHHKDIELISFALAWKGQGWYFPLRHIWVNDQDVETPGRSEWSKPPKVTNYENLPFEETAEILRPFLESEDVIKVGSYIQFDYRITKILMGITMRNMMDIGSLSRIQRSYEKSGLKQLMEYELERYPWEQDDLKSFMKEFRLKFPQDMGKVPVSILGPYNVSDVYYTLVLFYRFMREFKSKKQKRLVRLESQLIPVLAEMEIRGFPVSVPYLDIVSRKLQKQKDTLLRKIQKAAGFDLNPGSSQQLCSLLYGKKNQKVQVGPIMVTRGLGLKPPRMTRGGENSPPKPSTDERALKELREEDPIIDMVLEYRGLSKLKDTYVDGKKGLIQNQKDGFVHPDIFTDAARSGRLAAREPSLMNIPKKKKIIRRAFVANRRKETGYGLLFLDSSQIELRIFAHYLGDKEIIQRMMDGQDFHTISASVMFGIPVEELQEGVDAGDDEMKELRSKGKTINFAILYGAGLGQLASQIEEDEKPITLERAQELLDLYYKSLPSVGNFKDYVDEEVRAQGKVASYFGRVREFPVVFAYAAINHIIQSTAADCLKWGMLRADRYLQDFRTMILLPIHDEIVMRYDKRDDLFQIVAGVSDSMTNFQFKIPLMTGVSYTEKTWADKEDINVRERWLDPGWNTAQEWLKGETRRLKTTPHDILKTLKTKNERVCRATLLLEKKMRHTLKFQSELLFWNDRLKEHKEVWGEAIQAWKA